MALSDALRLPELKTAPAVTFLVETKDPRTIASIEAQPCEKEILDFKDFKNVRTEFAAIVGNGAILEPGAVTRWFGALGEKTAAVYGDWDLIEQNGARHSPRFTPEMSPELLRHTMYWGQCFLVRTSELQAAQVFGHELALRLADKEVARVPRMLWHATHDGEIRSKLAPITRVEERAAVVICSRNPRLLKECLASMRRTIDSRHEIIVVAHEIDLKPVADPFGARTVPYKGAFHFGLMNHRGAEASTGSVLVFVNDDIEPQSADWLESMIAQAARPEIGAVGALLWYPDRSLQHAGIVMRDAEVPAHAGRFSRKFPLWPWMTITREVSAVTGACLAMRRAVWNELGGFDPQFPVNYNDIDLCLRARERGYRILLEARAVLTHKESQSRVPVVRIRERDLFWDRWEKFRDAPDPYFNPQLSTPDERVALRDPWD